MIPKNCFFLSSDQAHTDRGSKLLGYASTNDALIFGTQGLSEYTLSGGKADDLEDGRFIGLFAGQQQSIIRTDRTGQEQLYLFADGDFWAVSNSFMLLVSQVAQSHKLSLYPPAIIGFHLKGGRHIGEQTLSHKTAISGIRLIPALNDLVIDHATNQLSEVRGSVASEIAQRSGTYAESVLDFLEERAGLLQALAGTGIATNMMLSGGYDSRLVLGLLAASGAHEAVHVASHEDRVDDFRSASAVTEALGIPMNQHAHLRHGQAAPSDAMRLWLMSCGCTYLPFYRVGSFSQDADFEFRVTGDQPTGWDHFAGAGKFKGAPSKIAKDIETDLSERPFAAEVARDFLSVFDDIDFDPNAPGAMFAHYGAIRARHHCGRNWYKSLGSERLFTPLMDFKMVQIDTFAQNQGWPEVKFFADAFSAIGGWALDTPFETPDRAFAPELLENSPFRGGVTLKPRPFRVFGAYHEPAHDDSLSMMSLPIRAKSSDAALKEQLAHSFWTADRAKQSGLFSKEDAAIANREAAEDGSLSSSFRKLSHFAMTETLLELIEHSEQLSRDLPMAVG